MDFVLGRAKAFRDAIWRADPAYLQNMRSASSARYLVTDENKIALLPASSTQGAEAEVSSGAEVNAKGAAPRHLLLLSHSQVPPEIAAQANYLGIYSQTPYFGIELGRLAAGENNPAVTLPLSPATPATSAAPPLASDDLPLVLPPQSEFLPLYVVGPDLSDLEVGLATAQIALGNWQLSQKYCSVCAAPTSFQNGGWEAHCARGHIIFPRTDPSVIVGVLDAQDRLLLGRKAAWDKRRFSALAGFIEAGETAEMAVVREVQEEAGIAVGDVQY
ncbi:NAD(+) diphosphatase, partial [uncultured Arcanobacterium sp.]|uniref:NAD(+) diphosphatase n=1 Tax=uncultured Arcanobacterium sp. TaxID=487520 RepID=UPI0026165D65